MKDYEQIIVAAGLASVAGLLLVYGFMFLQESYEKKYLYNIGCSRYWNYSRNGVYMVNAKPKLSTLPDNALVMEKLMEKHPLVSFVILPTVVLLLAGGVIGVSMLFISMLL